MSRIRLPANGWQPRPYQRGAWDYLENGGKLALIFAHRRWGKDELALHRTAISAFQKPATYWHMLPEASQARKAIWEAINPHSGIRRIDEAFPHEIRETTREQEMFIKFKSGATWQVVGSDNYNSLVGSPPYGVVFSEWALANPAAYAYLAPILLENGGWAMFITTPRGENHAFDMIQSVRDDGGYVEISDVTMTDVFTEEGLAKEQRRLIGLYGEDAGKALYRQEYMCDFSAAVLGSYWAREIEEADRAGRIRRVDVDPSLPVHTAWDLGVGDDTVIWFWQAAGREIRLVDYYASHGHGIEHYASVIREKGYRPGDDFVPHDAKVRELGTGRTRIETMIRAGLRPRLVAAHGLDDGINAARQTIPRCWFDAEKCKPGVAALKAYRRHWDEKLRAFRDAPVHDWASHPSDAFRYLSMAWREIANVPTPANDRILSVGSLNQVRFDDLWDERPKRRARL